MPQEEELRARITAAAEIIIGDAAESAHSRQVCRWFDLACDGRVSFLTRVSAACVVLTCPPATDVVRMALGCKAIKDDHKYVCYTPLTLSFQTWGSISHLAVEYPSVDPNYAWKKGSAVSSGVD